MNDFQSTRKYTKKFGIYELQEQSSVSVGKSSSCWWTNCLNRQGHTQVAYDKSHSTPFCNTDLKFRATKRVELNPPAL